MTNTSNTLKLTGDHAPRVWREETSAEHSLRFGEQICKLALRGNIVRDKSTLKVLITKEEGINTYVLGERVLGWIQYDLNGPGVVTIESSRTRRRHIEVGK